MEYIKIPEFPVLQGEKAIDVLSCFIKELHHGSKELTEKQTKALIKLANGLILTIKTETKASLHWNASPEQVRSLYLG